MALFFNAPPLPEKFTYSYGTSGFRLKADLLPPVLYRSAILATLRSQSHNGQHVGVMVTASHNPCADNGVKLTEPNADMLLPEWELYATQLANAKEPTDIEQIYNQIIRKEGIDTKLVANIVVARDTRPSGVELVNQLKAAAKVLKANVKDFGIFTTPQLHYVTRCINTQNTPDDYGIPTEQGYYNKLATAFKSLVHGLKPESVLYVDCANGVGAPKAKALFEMIGKDCLDVKLVGTDTETPENLNKDCGADYVKVEQRAPAFISKLTGLRCASLDGDADRVVFYFEEDGVFRLLDGDKISALAAGYISELVSTLKLAATVGVVQTAYANGSSTRYFDSVGVPTACTETGVKHLHHKAQEFDVGVYFEANGHGTILFSQDLQNKLNGFKATDAKEEKALEIFTGLTMLINQTVGDALSDLLAVEAILRLRKWDFPKWNSLYTDLPSRQSKVTVKDRQVFVTRDADRICVEPAGLQVVIDEHVKQYSKARAFVRPSGTEDVVRVYAEAETREMTDKLASTLCVEVYERAGGVGAKPAISG